ncbi:MAG: galactokinase [Planctomycetaceae bacterium]|jgi:galactokinase|nr:galactokinase [Planctomycetaceae bacterium]
MTETVSASSATGSAPFVVRTPGRVNLIGEHTDYNDGFVLPMAIDRGLRLTVRPRTDRRAVFRSEREAAAAVFDLDAPLVPAGTWSDYPAGVLLGFLERGWRIPGFEAVVSGDLPSGAGLSSSAALEVATATVVETLCARTLPLDAKALLCQRAENLFAGVPCGIMDQFAVTCGRAGHALLLDCRNRGLRHVPLDDPSICVLVIDSGVKHSLGDGEYATRRGQCASAATLLGCATLRDVTPAIWRARAATLPDLERRRAAHVLAENDRTLAFVAAVEAADWPRAGRLMRESHESLARDYEVSCSEMELLVSAAAALPGVHGCRMTGGGFGGCAVALVAAAGADTVMAALRRSYRDATGIEAEMFLTRAAAGPTVSAT